MFLLDQLSKIGLEIIPFYLVEEGSCGNLEGEHNEGFGGFEISLAGPDEMDVMSQIPGRNISKEELFDRLERNHRCFVMKHNGQIAAFTWANLSECHDKVHRFALKDNEAYLYDAYTLEAFRGKRIAPYMRYRCYKALNELGRHRFYSISQAFNSPSIRFKTRLKAKFLSLWLFAELFGKYRRTWKLRDCE